jgi:hypothetical protein
MFSDHFDVLMLKIFFKKIYYFNIFIKYYYTNISQTWYEMSLCVENKFVTWERMLRRKDALFIILVSEIDDLNIQLLI